MAVLIWLISNQMLVRKRSSVSIAVITTLFILSSSIINYDYFEFTQLANGQPNPDQTNSTNSVNILDIPLEKVCVGDIDIAYKMIGKGDPLLLFNGASDGMDAWDPSFPASLSLNHTVIVYDPRGIGNTTIGTEPYNYQQLANDSVGLLDALKIP